jgi:hypothetical protein
MTKAKVAALLAVALFVVGCKPAPSNITNDNIDTKDGDNKTVEFNPIISVSTPYHGDEYGHRGSIMYSLVPIESLDTYEQLMADDTVFESMNVMVSGYYVGNTHIIEGRIAVVNWMVYDGSAYTVNLEMDNLYYESQTQARTKIVRGHGGSVVQPRSENFEDWRITDSDIEGLAGVAVGREYYVIWSIVSEERANGKAIITNINLDKDVLDAYYRIVIEA